MSRNVAQAATGSGDIAHRVVGVATDAQTTTAGVQTPPGPRARPP